MTIYRADPPEVETLEIELAKKAGKNLGIGFFATNPRGILVTDIVSGFESCYGVTSLGLFSKI